jgi:hypothetical protein
MLVNTVEVKAEFSGTATTLTSEDKRKYNAG